MKKITWLTGDSQGCGTYRMIFPAEAMSQRGYDCWVDNKLPMKRNHDLIVGQRICNPGITKIWQEELSQYPRVFEVDDDLWSIRPQSSAYSFYSKIEVRTRLAQNARAADAVTVTTPFLAEVMSKYNENVHVLPNYLPDRIFELEQRELPEQFTFGWSGGPTHKLDASVINYPLKSILKRSKNVNFHCTGWNIGAYLNLRHTYTYWTKNIWEHYQRLNFHVGLAPLRPDPFNRAKSPIKALEYAARGMPVIASGDSPYDLLKDQEWIIICNTDQEWLSAMRLLMNDEDTRREMGKKAYEWATQQTYNKNIHKWIEAYGV